MTPPALTMTPVVGSDALAAAFARHHAGAVRLAYLLCGDAADAEDAVADVWVKVHARLASGPIDDVGAYVRRAVVNQVNSRFRRLRLVRRETVRRRGDDRGTRAHDDQVADGLTLMDALQRLPERTRAVVVLRYYADLSVAETARLLEVSEGTVKSTTSRGLDALQRLLDEGTTR